MNTIAPVLVLLTLATIIAVILGRWTRRWWISVLLSAVVSTFLWVAGQLTLFYFTAPSELGPIYWRGVLYAFLTSAIPALLVCLFKARQLPKRLTA